jgi:hypothetical protein
VGHCTYQFNPSEIYQRTRPGQGVETVCGGTTFPAVDDPEIVPVRMPNPGSAEAIYSYHATGRMNPRPQDDPYCPVHGGSPEPPPPPVTMEQLQAAHAAYLELAARFDSGTADRAVTGVPLPELQAAVPPSAAAAPAPVTADQLAAASRQLAQLAALAGQQAAAPPAPEQEVTDEPE